MPGAHIVIVGAGVIGLTTGVEALKKGYKVTIVAAHLPGYYGIEYTSAWAGAHHVSSSGDDERQRRMDQDTFKIMWEMSDPSSPAQHCFLRQPQLEYFAGGKRAEDNGLDLMPDYTVLDKRSLPDGDEQGVTFTTLAIDTPRYLPYLNNMFLSLGGQIVQKSIQHVAQLVPPIIAEPATAIIICAGLGARSLGGVEDKDVYPIRGQTVIVRAPHIVAGRTRTTGTSSTYIIPRRSGDIILGGFKTDNDWTSTARPEQSTDILERCLALYPELVPVERRRDPQNPTIDELRSMIVMEGCGLRPARKGGIRFGWEVCDHFEQPTALVYQYGHGGYGYQCSWASAETCLKDVSAAVERVEKLKRSASKL